jgi:predicted phosphodiesterase
VKAGRKGDEAVSNRNRGTVLLAGLAMGGTVGAAAGLLLARQAKAYGKTATSRRLSEVFDAAKQNEVSFDENGKFILFSDCHRGDNSWADDFAHNENIFLYALDYYLGKGFTYIEVGDGEELWENERFEDIVEQHREVYYLMNEFHSKDRLYLIRGNHDIERQDRYDGYFLEGRGKALQGLTASSQYYHDLMVDRAEEGPLFEDIEVHEGLVLRYEGTENRIFVVHGHQGDLINDYLWRLGKFGVMHGWRHLQLAGVNDLTSPAKNPAKAGRVERRIKDWIKAHNRMTICGHTHVPRFPKKGSTPYFNTGSCVHPRSITGIEIKDGNISLIRWRIKPTDKPDDGLLKVDRDPPLECQSLRDFFKP